MGEPTTRPQVSKGALAVYTSQAPGTTPDRTIVFQYNPEALRRSFATRTAQKPAASSGDAKEAVLAVPGPPVETITLSVVIDAIDQLDDPSRRGILGRTGIMGALAALELLLYPSSADVNTIEQQAQRGEVHVQAADTPLVILNWGSGRALPVQLTSLAISEDEHDPMLNPIRAKADLGLKVLTYMEFPKSSVGRDAFIAHQKRQERLAREWVGQ